MAEIFRFIHSIRFRLALWFAGSLALVLVAFSAFIYARQLDDLRTDTLEQLNQKTQRWEAFLNFVAREYFDYQRVLVPNEMYGGEVLLEKDDILALVQRQGKLVQQIGSISTADFQSLVDTAIGGKMGTGTFSYTIPSADVGGRTYREEYTFVVAPISVDRQTVGYFILGSPIDPGRQLRSLLFTLAAGNLLMLGLALVGGYWLADRAMSPVKSITRAAQEISETDLSRRLRFDSKDELGELAATFDGMLARLEAAFNRQRQFTADASHELRTPLTIVGSEAGRALAAHRTNREYEEALSVIQSENEYMTRLVNSLLTLSRMDSGQANLQKEELDLSDVALEAVERLAPLAERRGVELSTGELPEIKVEGDRQYLSQMIANLVENAIKYSGSGRGRVRVSAGVEPVDQPRFGWVRVSDNGPGIAPEHLPRIFDRFYQVDKARSRTLENGPNVSEPDQIESGSGLGLSIVQWIAEAHGGNVRVDSELSRGSAFTVSIPLER